MGDGVGYAMPLSQMEAGARGMKDKETRDLGSDDPASGRGRGCRDGH